MGLSTLEGRSFPTKKTDFTKPFVFEPLKSHAEELAEKDKEIELLKKAIAAHAKFAKEKISMLQKKTAVLMDVIETISAEEKKKEEEKKIAEKKRVETQKLSVCSAIRTSDLTVDSHVRIISHSGIADKIKGILVDDTTDDVKYYPTVVVNTTAEWNARAAEVRKAEQSRKVVKPTVEKKDNGDKTSKKTIVSKKTRVTTVIAKKTPLRPVWR